MQYGRFTGLVLSLFLPAFYRDVARNWGGIGLLYLLLVLTLTWIPVLVKMQLGFQKFAQEDFPKVGNKIPDITIRGGRVSSPVPQPFEIKDENGNTVFVLDTTGKINSLDQAPLTTVMLVTETKMHQRDQQRIQIHDLTQFPDFELTAARIQGWIDTAGTWVGVILYPFVMFGSLIRALVIMLIASLAGLMFNAAFGGRVGYGGLLRFAAVGMTLSYYIDTGLMLASIQVPFWFLIVLALTIGYVAFGAMVTPPPPMDMSRDDRPPQESRPWPNEDDQGRYQSGTPPGYDDGGYQSGRP